MKFLTLNTLVILLALANMSQASETSTFVLKYTIHSKEFVLEQKATSFTEAIELASQKCFNSLKNGRKIAEEEGLDIIDTCVNPRRVL